MENQTTLESKVAQAVEYASEHYHAANAKRQMDEFVGALIRNFYEKPHVTQNEELLKGLLAALGLDCEASSRIAERDLPEKVTIPVDVAVTRHYRTYVECYDGAYEEDIRRKAVEQIVENQDDVLTLDPDLEIEENDVGCMYANFDGVQEA